MREIPGITLLDMDDLQREVARNLSGREAEAARARTLIDDEVERYRAWLASLEVVPTVAALRERGEAIARAVLRENEPRWESVSEADRDRLERMARAIVSRMLHEPTRRLKNAPEGQDSYVYVQALRELFALETVGSYEDVAQDASPEVASLEDRRRRHRTG
ncbi:MAG: hypothetical protein WKF31_09350 [Thermoleophilaceae bacterium]